jgi:hypothetical protein
MQLLSRWNMEKRGKIILPGDRGFNENKYREYQWNVLRQLAGLAPKKKVGLEIHGFVVNDFRTNPPVSIWKNCRMELKHGFKPPLPEEPVPFQYLEEAMAYKESMHLSAADSEKVKITALCPEPGLGEPAPNMIFMSKKDAKGR